MRFRGRIQNVAASRLEGTSRGTCGTGSMPGKAGTKKGAVSKLIIRGQGAGAGIPGVPRVDSFDRPVEVIKNRCGGLSATE